MLYRALATLALLASSAHTQTFINYSGAVRNSSVGMPHLSPLLPASHHGGHHQGYGGGHHASASLTHTVAVGTSDPCNPSPCGPNTRCDINHRGIGACRCLDGFFPKPNTITGCGPQCVSDSECGSPRFVCQNQKCVNPCVDSNPCGINANCDVRNHLVTCSCPPGYDGNAYSRCSLPQSSASARIGGFSHTSVHGPPIVGSASRHTFRSAPGGSVTYTDSYSSQCSSCAQGHSQVQVRGPPAPPRDPCSGGVCGTNAHCDGVNGRAVCSCPAGYQGNPLVTCRRGECSHDSQCAAHKACIDVTCQDPCSQGVCGSGAECTVENHRAICSCPKNYIGDPFTSCRYDPEAACTPSPCGENTDCRVKNSRAVCSCIQNYVGNPLTGCRPECISDAECSSTQHCVTNRCKNACTGACGRNAQCDVVNHQAVCKCPQYYQGNALTGCYAECTSHQECPAHRVCIHLQCADPCQDACGVGAECQVTNRKAICKCPKGYEGHPFTSCYPAPPIAGADERAGGCTGGCGSGQHITKTSFRQAPVSGDMCVPNPCGSNADCNHGTDRSGDPRPVCTCPRGFLGDPLTACRRGECLTSGECSSSQACYNYHCVNPCVDSAGITVCGTNAVCNPKNHKPVCSCPQEYTGDPLTECRLKPIARSNDGRRFKRFIDALATAEEDSEGQ